MSWRQIAEFPDYWINPDGEIKHGALGHYVKVRDGLCYLYVDGVAYHRSVRALLSVAYPHHFLDAFEEKKDDYSEEEWVDIPGYPGFQLSNCLRVRRLDVHGELMYYRKVSRFTNKQYNQATSFVVRLPISTGGRKSVGLKQLFEEAFGFDPEEVRSM